MKPPMKQSVKVFLPELVDGKEVTDRYGRAKTVEVISRARVQFKSSVIRDAQGIDRRVALEIDLPPQLDVQVGHEIEYTTISGRVEKGTVITKEESTNLAGNKVFFRTVYLDG